MIRQTKARSPDRIRIESTCGISSVATNGLPLADGQIAKVVVAAAAFIDCVTALITVLATSKKVQSPLFWHERSLAVALGAALPKHWRDWTCVLRCERRETVVRLLDHSIVQAFSSRQRLCSITS